MKQLFTLCLIILFNLAAFAQVPKAINYQAVARNAGGQALANQPIKVRFSILKITTGTQVLYTETRNLTTNGAGLFTAQIGSAGAQVSTGQFDDIDWISSPFATMNLKVEIDINNTGFLEMGTQQLVSVPYALSADQAVNARRIGGNLVQESAPDVNDILVFDGVMWKPTRKSSFLPKTIAVYREQGNLVSGGNLGTDWAAMPYEVIIDKPTTVIAVISANFATTSGTATNPEIAACYQLINPDGTPGTSITRFNYNSQVVPAITAQSTPYTTSGVVEVLPPGKYLMGLGVRNTSSVHISKIENITGFITVTNQ